MSANSVMNVLQIVVSIVLVLVVLIQAKGSGFGTALGSTSSVFRTRRGIERTLFQSTIILGIVWVFVSIISVIVTNN
jgi:preprotein translocase subunit SecG